MSQVIVNGTEGNLTVDLGAIQLQRSITPGAVPTAGLLAEGELALNLKDRKIFTKDELGNVITLGRDYSQDIADAETNALAAAKVYTDGQVTTLKGGADTANDTLGKLAARIDQVSNDLSSGIGDLTKADIGLGNVENYTISDATNEDVSTQYASSKAVHDTFQRAVAAETTAVAYADQVKSDLLGGAPSAALDTLIKLGDALTDNSDAISAINTALALRAETTYVDAELAKKVDKTSISDATNSQSTTNVASSKAVDDLRQALEASLTAGLATKIDKSVISDSYESQSQTNVASSKAVNDGFQAAIAHADALATSIVQSDWDYGVTF